MSATTENNAKPQEKIPFVDFSAMNFDAIVCLNATLPSPFFFEQHKDLPLIAADGAASKLLNLGIVPRFVVGDMDSVLIEELTKQLPHDKIIHLTDQDTNDFEKILNFAISKQWNSLLIVGFHGGELEHTLNNWSVLKKFSTKMNLVINDCQRLGITVNSKIEFVAKPNEIISLIPQTKTRLSTHNLRWELCNEYLEIGKREGARNQAIAEKVSIEVFEGSLLLFVDEER